MLLDLPMTVRPVRMLSDKFPVEYEPNLPLNLALPLALALALALTVALALALTLTPGARLARLLVLAQREPQRQRALPRLQWPGTLAHGDGGLGVGRRQG